MSDVELGGATVFPLVGARIKATKVRTEQGQFVLCNDICVWWSTGRCCILVELENVRRGRHAHKTCWMSRTSGL